ncbi:MAG: dockerin type I domain-containing protein [Myxococcota bacterium]
MLKVVGSLLIAASTFAMATASFAQEACPASTDINGDGITDGLDVDIIQASLGIQEGEDGFVAAADLNGDGAISTMDYTLMLACN